MKRRIFLRSSIFTTLAAGAAEASPIDPKETFPAGSFVKRAARSFHYDSVPSGVERPVVVAVFGIGPVDIELADPHQPSWRRV